MPFHDYGVVVYRFGLGPNDLSRNIALSCVLVNFIRILFIDFLHFLLSHFL